MSSEAAAAGADRRRVERGKRRSRALGATLAPATALALLAAIASGGGAARPSGEQDIEQGLRNRVERLVVESARPSSDPDVLRRRLETLWEWSEAFALAGGVVPPDFPRHWGVAYHATRGSKELHSSRSVGELVEPGAGVTMKRVSEFVRNRVREFRLKEEQPRALGTVELDDPGPFVAGDHVTLVQRYVVGERPLPAGTRFLLAHRRVARFQVDDPRAAGYTTLRVSRPGTRLAAEPLSARWQSAQIYPVAAYRVEGEALRSGDVVTFTYGDRSGGSPGLAVPSASGDDLKLPLFVDLFGDGDMLTPAWPSWSIVGRPETRFVNAIGPSIVAPGEPFTLAVRSEDAFKNPVSGPAPGYTVRLDGRVVARAAAGGPAVWLVGDLSITEPGPHRFEVEAPEHGLAVRSNPIVVDASPERRLLWGDTHGHTGFAEGRGSPDAFFRFGRDVARLDFLTLSEHDVWMDALEWRELADQTEAFHDPGRFTTVFGYEWTASTYNGGHHNVFFRSTRGRQPAPQQWIISLEQLYGALRQDHRTEDVLIVPHAHMPGDWRRSEAAMERLVEISSGHGSWEWFGNRYLRSGFRVGFVGASDNHAGHPGYSVGSNTQLGGLAAVFAEENSRDAVFDALRSRRCYATTGERIVLLAELDSTPMGRQLPPGGERRLRCRVHGTLPIDAIEVVKNGETVYSQRYLEASSSRGARIQVLFESSTELHGDYRGPAWRERPWRGWLEVRGATLADLELPWFHDPTTDRIVHDPEVPDRVRFSFVTSGRGKGLVLSLQDGSDESMIVVHLDAVTGPSRPVASTPPEAFPAVELALRLGDLTGNGPAVNEIAAGDHRDRVEVRAVVDGGAYDRELEWRDLDESRDGDYYYVRVRQLDGSMAWSSPFWAGPG